MCSCLACVCAVVELVVYVHLLPRVLCSVFRLCYGQFFVACVTCSFSVCVMCSPVSL